MSNFNDLKNLPYELFYLPVQETNISLFSEEEENSDPNTIKVKGYAAKFNIYSNLLLRYNYDKGDFEEVYHIIEPGSFDDVLKGNLDVIFTKNHNWDNVIARYTNHDNNVLVDTLTLKTDEIGLYFEASLSKNHTYASDLIENIRRKEISANSFAVIIDEEKTEWSKYQEKPLKIIRRFSELRDVSPVIFPAFPHTELTISSYKQHAESMQKTKKVDDIYYKEQLLKLLR